MQRLVISISREILCSSRTLQEIGIASCTRLKVEGSVQILSNLLLMEVSQSQETVQFMVVESVPCMVYLLFQERANLQAT